MIFSIHTLNRFNYILQKESILPTLGGDLASGMTGRLHQAFLFSKICHLGRCLDASALGHVGAGDQDVAYD